MAPVDPQGEADQPAGVELVEGILFPEPSQSQPSTILGWNLSSVWHLDITHQPWEDDKKSPLTSQRPGDHTSGR